MNKRIIHIVGLQKSGTSLLVRLLENSGLAQMLDGAGKTEGGIDWGQSPSFSPTQWPAGVIYQRTRGANGHEIDALDATEEICDSIRKETGRKLDGLPTELGLSKCPYSAVRLPWIRAIIPEAFIVGIVRGAVPNVYSLWKRFHPNGSTKLPEEGWWGVKPNRWRDLVSQNKIEQLARQWNAVNLKLLEDRTYLDRVVSYSALCAHPAETIRAILTQATGRNDVPVSFEFSSLSSCDDEFKTGSRLSPRRADWVGSNDLVLQMTQPIELPPIDGEDIRKIEAICSDTMQQWERLFAENSSR